MSLMSAECCRQTIGDAHFSINGNHDYIRCIFQSHLGHRNKAINNMVLFIIRKIETSAMAAPIPMKYTYLCSDSQNTSSSMWTCRFHDLEVEQLICINTSPHAVKILTEWIPRLCNKLLTVWISLITDSLIYYFFNI